MSVEEIRPTTYVDGSAGRVRFATPLHDGTELPATGCEAVELGGDWPSAFRVCGLPVFATLYAGDGADFIIACCWRHLVKLGDTGSTIVRPATSTAVLG